jgi:hypothetical protein
MARVPYKKLLTEAISEFDTSKTAEVKGPFLDPILSWDGGGELPTNKAVDAGSILERYYFKEQADDGVQVEADYSGNDDTEATSYEVADEVKGKSTDHTVGAGTEQAGTHEAGHDKAEKREEEIAKEDYDLTEDLENSIIEKIISEMEEEEDDDEDDDKEEMSEAEDKFEGVKKALQMPDEKEMKDPEEHSMGAGTPQAGTGDMEGEVPDRKDMADKMVKAHNYSEAALFEEDDMDDDDDEGMDEEMKEALSLLEMDDEDEDMKDEEEMEESFGLFEQEEEGGEEEDEDLDVDEKMEEYAFPGGPTPHQHKAKHGADGNAVDIEEAFKIFQEQMDDDEEDEDEEEDED